MKNEQHMVHEWEILSNAPNPFYDPALVVDVVISLGDKYWRVPTFYAGPGEYKARFAPPEAGQYRWVSESTDPSYAGQEGTFTATAYSGSNPILRHGPLKVSDDGRTFVFADGTPFFWLGDTWWMGFTKRLPHPEGFEKLADDRVSKNFTLIQIVAGIYPDMPYGDPRGENEAGLPYDDELNEVNTAWWELADRKIETLVEKGLMPCIVGCWGYYVALYGVEKVKRHWRNIVARWGAYPVTWCLAGEAKMPYYRDGDWERDPDRQSKMWTEVGEYLQALDPMGRPVTIHPTQSGREQVEDDSVLDYDMLQTGHEGSQGIPNSVEGVRKSRGKSPTMPVVIGEVIYEGIMHDSDAEKERLVWWASMLSGAAGFTYGANGIWQLNQKGKPYGPSPHGGNWGNTPWDEAMHLPGSKQLGYSAAILQKHDWPRMEPHQEWVEPQAADDDYYTYFAAGVPGEFRLIYSYRIVFPWAKERMRTVGLESDRQWSAVWHDPRTGDETSLGVIEPDADGNWDIPLAPEMKDYVLALESHAK